ncbi:MAG: phosphoribosyltransferase domain-containing protein [Desulfovibrionaceae bacterium]|nr:phosphoribosyltransferase domain-containing protein [Desulfovibrionaceae bacterium]
MTRIIELVTGRLEVTADGGDMDLDALTGFAARNNPRRGFLFVSRVLGKHLPVRPSAMLRAQRLLAGRLPDDLPRPLLCIGMAETATALGQGVFEACMEDGAGTDGLYVHTTRYRLGELECLSFDESHSHAARHFLHLPREAALRRLFAEARTLVLVDDEMSTGNTFANLARAVRRHSPRLRRVAVATLINWLAPPERAALARRFPCPVEFVQLLEGSFRFTPDPTYRFGAPARSEAEPVRRDAQLSLPGGRRGAAFGLTPLPVPCRPSSVAREPGTALVVLGRGGLM